ncbi:hypothetical protein F4808DRAFT_99592 [Astrocystis sublimbata]|nr:hypothetical protein F4808DRAFT_99592 [Astrocystis sublimbata]
MAGKHNWWSYHQGPWNATKCILRCVSFVSIVIATGLTIENGVRPGLPSRLGIDWWITLPYAIPSIIVDSIELTCSILRKRNPGIPPGWHIGAELVLIGGCLVALVFLSSAILSATYGYRSVDNPLAPPLSFRSSQIADVTFIVLFLLVRVILLVFASVDTHRYRQAAEVKLIARALRRQNLDESLTAMILHNLTNPKNPQSPKNQIDLEQPPPSHDFDFVHKMLPMPYPNDESAQYRELPDNTKFLSTDLPPRIYKPN